MQRSKLICTHHNTYVIKPIKKATGQQPPAALSEKQGVQEHRTFAEGTARAMKSSIMPNSRGESPEGPESAAHHTVHATKGHLSGEWVSLATPEKRENDIA